MVTHTALPWVKSVAPQTEESMKIIDEDGIVHTNTGNFAFADPISGHVFNPGEPVKVKSNAWIEGQPTIKAEAPTEPAKDSKKK